MSAATTRAILARVGVVLGFVIVAAVAAVLPTRLMGVGAPPPALAVAVDPAALAADAAASGSTVDTPPLVGAGTDAGIPESIEIPALGAQAPVLEVGLDESGGVVVPDDVTTVGWYRGSVATDASAGSTVIVGHRNSAVLGSGAFDNLESLDAGDRIRVVDREGEVLRYRVSDVEFVLKEDFDSIVREAFGSDGEERLTLITCGGEFDESARSYLSNIIVTAYPEA